MEDSQQAWEEEYTKKRLMTGDKPAKSLVHFVKFLKKEYRAKGVGIEDMRVLDLGSGEGKNAIYLAGLGIQVDCIEIARNAVATTQQKINQGGLTSLVRVKQGSMGDTGAYEFPDEAFDIIIDVTSSNSLSEAEREVYLEHSARVLKQGGYMFVRALCKDGDSNAKQLLKDHPGQEKDTYVMPGWGQTERVFTEYDIRELYEQYFTILTLEKETHYTNFNNKRFRRNFWVMYLQK